MKKRIFSLVLALVMMVSLLPNAFAAKKPTFTDVSKDMWCFDYVEFVAKRGYFKGTTETTFAPSNTMTRQQFVTVLARMAGVKVDNSVTAFSDVPAGSYSAGSVAWAAKNGIVTGYADGTFHPTAPVTRQQMCAFMSRFMDYYSTVHGAFFLKRGTVSGFADYNQVADYAKSAVDRCRTYGLIQGYAEDNTFRPANSATRAHVAAVIYRLAQVLRMAGGGSGGSGGPDYTYTLTYTDTNAANGSYAPETVETDDEYAIFTVKAAPDYALVDNTLAFVSWYDAATQTSYTEGQTVKATVATPDITLDAAWTNPDDLLYKAMSASVNYVNDQVTGTRQNGKAGQIENLVKDYATLQTLSMGLAPAASDVANREVALNAEATLSANLDDNLILTAAYYAYNLLNIADPNAAGAEYVVTVADAEDLIASLLNVLDPSMTWWEGATRTAKIKNLGAKLYETVKNEAWPHGSALWNNFQFNGQPIVTGAKIMDGNTVLLTVSKGMDYKAAVKVIAKTMASKLYASLKANHAGSEYFYNLNLDGMLTVDFILSTDPLIQAKAGQFATKYDTYATVKLNQGEEILGYRFDGTNYIKLTINEVMQREYAEFVDAVAKEAMAKPEVKKALLDALTAKLDSFATDASAAEMRDALVSVGKVANDAEAAAYIKNIFLKKDSTGKSAVEKWVETNLSTDDTATFGYYLPFNFFWNMGGTVNADGSLNVPSRGVAVLGDQTALLQVVDAEVEAIMEEAIDKAEQTLLNEYQLVVNDITNITEAEIEALLDSKLNGEKAAINAELVNIVKANSMAVTAINTMAPEHKADLFLLTSGNIDDLTVEGIDNALNYPDDQCVLCEYVRDILLTLGLETEIENAYNDFAAANASLISNLVGSNAADQAKFKALVLNKLGFVQTYPASASNGILTVIKNNVQAKIDEKMEGFDTAELEAKLNTAVATAAGAYAEYLNKVTTVKTLKNMSTVTIGNMISVMESSAVKGMLEGKSAPAFVQKLATAITKVESNTSSVTINGEKVDMTDVKAVKNALETGKADKICAAVADFLRPFSAMSVSTFEAGVPFEATVNYKEYSYTDGAVLVVEFAAMP